MVARSLLSAYSAGSFQLLFLNGERAGACRAIYYDILGFSARVFVADGNEFLTGPTNSKYVGRVQLDRVRSLGWLRAAGHSPDRRWIDPLPLTVIKSLAKCKDHEA